MSASIDDVRSMAPLGAVVMLTSLFLAWHGRAVLRGEWREARGYEFEWIAVPLSEGHGYSFEPRHAWLGPYEEVESPTAWVAPAQTTVMAVAFRLLGEEGRLALVLLNFVWFGGACVLVFEMGRQLGSPMAGGLGATMLAAIGPGKSELLYNIGNAAPTAALLTLVAVLLVVTLSRPSRGRAALLGLSIGVLALTHAGTLLFAPVVAVLTGLGGRRDPCRRGWLNGVIVLLTAAALVLPWTVRNWVAFGAVVPVRTGLGQNMHYALPALAQTIDPELDLGPEWGAPPWTARSAREAVAKILDQDRWRQLVDHSLEAGTASGPGDYSRLNEAQRDGVLFDQSLAFIRSHPVITTRLAVAKSYGFFWGNWPKFRVVTLLAIIGLGLVTVRPLGWVIPVLMGIYVIPYLLSAPIYYRYRLPIDPLIFLLAAMPLASLLKQARSLLGTSVAR